MTGSGILFVTMNKVTTELLYCMQYVHQRGWLEDFGGIKEKTHTTFIDNAIKECIEETNDVFRITPEQLKESILTSGIEHTTPNLRYHMYVVPISNYYLRYTSDDFGKYEKHECIQRTVLWLTLDEILKIGVHPRCSSFFMH